MLIAAATLTLAAQGSAHASLLAQQVTRVPKFVKAAQDLGPANSLQVLTLGIHLRYPDEKAVQALANAVNDPTSNVFGNFLSPTQFIDGYEPSAHTYSTVEYVIGGAGGSVLQTFANNKVLLVSIPVLGADILFGTEVDQYSFKGTTYYANSKPAYMPTLLKGLIRSVTGFTNFGTAVAQPPWPLGVPGLSPKQVQTAYDEPIAVNPQLTGSGTTIAIATAGDYLDSDVQGFWSTFGVSRTGSLTRIPVMGSTARRRGRPRGVPFLGPETTLDVEQTTSNAPGANVEVYEGSDTESTTFDSIYEGIVDDPNAQVVTTSFGACEIGADSEEIMSDNDLFEQAAAEGQTWFAASGDNGSHDCGTNAPPFGGPGETNPNSVDFPGSSPYVASAGGTTLTLRSNGTIKAERGWAGSGGGASIYFTRPPYQNAVMQSLPDQHARNVPDVALDADPNTPYAFYYDGSLAEAVAGTSAVAPNMAAIYAQMDQSFGYRLGLAQSSLYNGFVTGSYPGTAWHDVTLGRNGKYHAQAGYDDVTGVGSIDAYQLMLQTPPPAASRHLGSGSVLRM